MRSLYGLVVRMIRLGCAIKSIYLVTPHYVLLGYYKTILYKLKYAVKKQGHKTRIKALLGGHGIIKNF